MAIKKFIIEVEEGITKCAECPFDEYKCSGLGYIDAEMDCAKYNFATAEIKEYEED